MSRLNRFVGVIVVSNHINIILVDCVGMRRCSQSDTDKDPFFVLLFMGRSTCAPASTPVISGHGDVLCQDQNSVSEQRVDVNVCQLDKQVQFVVLVKTTTKI